MSKKKKEKLSKMLSKDFQHNSETDFTAEDLNLIRDPHELSREIEKARKTFKELTGEIPDNKTAESVLDDLVKEGLFTKFTVNMGWKIETVWRKV